MRMWKIFGLGLTLGALLLLGLVGTVGAQMGPGMMGGYGGYGYQTLTPEKQAAAQKIYADYYAQTNTTRQQLIAKQYELNALLYGGKADDKKVQELTKEVNDLRAKLYEAQVDLQKQLAKADIPVMGGGMGGIGMGPGLMGPGMMGPGYGGMY